MKNPGALGFVNASTIKNDQFLMIKAMLVAISFFVAFGFNEAGTNLIIAW